MQGKNKNIYYHKPHQQKAKRNEPNPVLSALISPQLQHSKCQLKQIVSAFKESSNFHQPFVFKEKRQKFRKIPENKRSAAIVFCYVQNGCEEYRDSHLTQRQPILAKHTEYKQLANFIVVQAFRLLEKHLIKTCHLPIKPLTQQEIGLLEDYLINCRHSLKIKECETFFKLVQAANNICNVIITFEEISGLYLSVRTILATLRSSMNQRLSSQQEKVLMKDQNNQQPSKTDFSKHLSPPETRINRIWKPRHQQMLCNLYAKKQDIPQIVQIFRKKHSSDVAHCFTERTIKRRLFKIFKDAIKRVRVQMKNPLHFGLPALKEISIQSLKSISKMQSCAELRHKLVKVMIPNFEWSFKKLAQLIDDLNGVSVRMDVLQQLNFKLCRQKEQQQILAQLMPAFAEQQEITSQ